MWPIIIWTAVYMDNSTTLQQINVRLQLYSLTVSDLLQIHQLTVYNAIKDISLVFCKIIKRDVLNFQHQIKNVYLVK